MIAAGPTHLRLDAEHTVLAFDSSDEVVLSLGVHTIGNGFFRHDPPTALEIEQAIDAIEDAMANIRLPSAERGDLATNEPLLQAWVTIPPIGVSTRLTRDEVEAIFERLASAALGRPGELTGLPTDRNAAAALLILRECMHHLGFDGIDILSSQMPG